MILVQKRAVNVLLGIVNSFFLKQSISISQKDANELKASTVKISGVLGQTSRTRIKTPRISD